MKTRRTYGNEKTKLALSDAAEQIYCNTDPLTIIEIEDEDGTLTYNLKGCTEAEGLSEEDLEDLLIELGTPSDDELVGMVYDDPEGRWTVVDVDNGTATVRCLASKVESEIGKEYAVPAAEARFYIEGGE